MSKSLFIYISRPGKLVVLLRLSIMQDQARQHINWPLIVRANINIAPPSIHAKNITTRGQHSDVVDRLIKQIIMYT